MKCQDKGYVTHGQDIDWVSDILRSTIDNENNACVVMYDGWTPFEMFHGRPMMAGFVVPPMAQDNADMYERMHQCQLARAYKLNMFPEYEPLLVGTVVNVRATKKEIKDNMALYVGVVCPWRHPRYPPSERKRDASQVAFGWIVVQP